MQARDAFGLASLTTPPSTAPVFSSTQQFQQSPNDLDLQQIARGLNPTGQVHTGQDGYLTREAALLLYNGFDPRVATRPATQVRLTQNNLLPRGGQPVRSALREAEARQPAYSYGTPQHHAASQGALAAAERALSNQPFGGEYAYTQELTTVRDDLGVHEQYSEPVWDTSLQAVNELPGLYDRQALMRATAQVYVNTRHDRSKYGSDAEFYAKSDPTGYDSACLGVARHPTHDSYTRVQRHIEAEVSAERTREAARGYHIYPARGDWRAAALRLTRPASLGFDRYMRAVLDALVEYGMKKAGSAVSIPEWGSSDYADVWYAARLNFHGRLDAPGVGRIQTTLFG